MKKIFTTCLMICLALIVKISSAQTQVTFYTTMGTFVASLEDVKRPITTTNFKNLIQQKFYDGIIFHRVVANFVIQGGDPTGTGTGGSGVTIPDELSPPVSNLQKVFGMANAGPNTATSQFYINLVNNTFLDPNYPAFATVITNFSVVQAIGQVPVDANDKPLTPVIMDSVRITFVPTGMDEIANKTLEVDVYPNPITEQSVVSINTNSAHTATVSIYNQLGMQLYTESKDLSEGINHIAFPEDVTMDLPQGMYFLLVRDESSVSQNKLIVVK